MAESEEVPAVHSIISYRVYVSLFPLLLDCGLLECRHVVITVTSAEQSVVYRCSNKCLTIWNQKTYHLAPTEVLDSFNLITRAIP